MRTLSLTVNVSLWTSAKVHSYSTVNFVFFTFLEEKIDLKTTVGCCVVFTMTCVISIVQCSCSEIRY